MGFRQLQLQCGVCGEITPHTQATPNHALHAVLTLFTGVWVIGWIVAASAERQATCGRCGTARSVNGPPTMALLGPGGEARLLDDLDESLRKLKGPLLFCRTKHGILGDVTFRLRYDAQGSIVNVTVDSGPPNMTPQFITDAATLIKGMLTLPRTAQGGIMNFTDLGPDKTDPYRS